MTIDEAINAIRKLTIENFYDDDEDECQLRDILDDLYGSGYQEGIDAVRDAVRPRR